MQVALIVSALAAASATAKPATDVHARSGAAAAADTNNCASTWSQCNGQNWPNGVCCSNPSDECIKHNDYYSQCVPKKTKPAPEACSPVEPVHNAIVDCQTALGIDADQSYPRWNLVQALRGDAAVRAKFCANDVAGCSALMVLGRDVMYNCVVDIQREGSVAAGLAKFNVYKELTAACDTSATTEAPPAAAQDCSENWSQCNGQNWPHGVCCKDPSFQCNHKSEYVSLCEPKDPKKAADAACTNVSVVGDATYCVQGAICGDEGDVCPKKGDYAVGDCLSTLTSYVGETKCVAPRDATCQKLPSGARGCVFGAVDTTTTAAPVPTAPCTNVSVVGDATYCVPGAICGDEGDVCPKKGDYAVGDCLNTLSSYVGATSKCVAPADATCQKLPSGARGCAFGTVDTTTTTTATPVAATTASPQTTTTMTTASPQTTKAGTNNGKCSTSWSQCNGQNWPFGVCCEDASFQCNFKNEYLSLCEPKAWHKDAQDVATVATWQQCGGKSYQGPTACTAGNTCEKINDWYSQCKPAPTKEGILATWAKCGGVGYKGTTTCRDEDKCQKYNDYYSQCIPK